MLSKICSSAGKYCSSLYLLTVVYSISYLALHQQVIVFKIVSVLMLHFNVSATVNDVRTRSKFAMKIAWRESKIRIVKINLNRTLAVWQL